MITKSARKRVARVKAIIDEDAHSLLEEIASALNISFGRAYCITGSATAKFARDGSSLNYFDAPVEKG